MKYLRINLELIFGAGRKISRVGLALEPKKKLRLVSLEDLCLTGFPMLLNITFLVHREQRQ